MSNPVSPADIWAGKLLLKAAEDESVLQIPEVPDGPFGFHAQQAVEKLFKALLLKLGFPLERTHDLEKLSSQLTSVGERLPATPLQITDLNRFAVIYRYENIPSLEIPDRPASIETVRILREHILSRIAALTIPPDA